jgi:hypothetical protein
VSEKSQVTQTSKNVFEKSNRKTQYFVRTVKDRRMTKNGVEFLIGWCNFPLEKDDTWEPIINLPGSEHIIAEFQKIGKQSTKLTLQLQSVIDKRNTRNEKNTQTQRMDEVRTDGDDDDETGYSEDDHGEDEDGSALHSKRRQTRSFYFTTGAVKRMESKEDGNLTATCQVGGHAQCINIILMTNGGTELE